MFIVMVVSLFWSLVGGRAGRCRGVEGVEDGEDVENGDVCRWLSKAVDGTRKKIEEGEAVGGTAGI